MVISLVMFTSKGERRSFSVRGDSAIVGRNAECDIQIKLGVISRRHCEITVKDDELSVRDLGSSNGTYVNNSRIQESVLNPGDTLTVGPVIFTVQVNGEPAQIKTVRTVLDPKREAARPSPKPKAKAKPKLDDTGSIDLDDSGAIDIVSDDEETAPRSNPLAELEQLAKQKRG